MASCDNMNTEQALTLTSQTHLNFLFEKYLVERVVILKLCNVKQMKFYRFLFESEIRPVHTFLVAKINQIIFDSFMNIFINMILIYDSMNQINSIDSFI